VVSTLKESFAHLKAAIVKMPDADLDKSLDWFGGKNTERGILLFHHASHGGAPGAVHCLCAIARRDTAVDGGRAAATSSAAEKINVQHRKPAVSEKAGGVKC
jgi:hypothetical protein